MPAPSGEVDPSALAAAIEDLLDHPPPRDKLADWTLRSFSEDQHFAALAPLYGLQLDGAV